MSYQLTRPARRRAAPRGWQNWPPVAAALNTSSEAACPPPPAGHLRQGEVGEAEVNRPGRRIDALPGVTLDQTSQQGSSLRNGPDATRSPTTEHGPVSLPQLQLAVRPLARGRGVCWRGKALVPHRQRRGTAPEQLIPFSAFWLKLSVVSVLISLISDI